ncbi:uncharacterized protein LOC126988689 isoform X3 [Eriocheir sinensis]|nr:uncharacterized protein LOC126988689 isoform X3 [Eriocheir sinensis]XP_050703007.1 uncharacterized protein LOC126988689 isoform X3 [Eriocheir sinensis]
MSPAGHTTTTTAPPPENTAGGGERKIFFNYSYLRTYEGILKLAQLVIAVLVFVSVMVSEHPRGGTSDWISFTSMGSFWFSGMLFVMYLVNAVVVLTDVPCGMLELVYTCLWTAFWFVSGCLAADFASKGAGVAFIVAASLSCLATIVFGLTAFLLYKKRRAGALSSAQPLRTHRHLRYELLLTPWMQTSYQNTSPSYRSGAISGCYNSVKKNVKSCTLGGEIQHPNTAWETLHYPPQTQRMTWECMLPGYQ